MLLGDKLVIIARWNDPQSELITLQTFTIEGRDVIPVFSDQEHFKKETRGSGFEGQGVEIDRALLSSILTGNEVLVLDPGSANRSFSKADLEAGVI